MKNRSFLHSSVIILRPAGLSYNGWAKAGDRSADPSSPHPTTTTGGGGTGTTLSPSLSALKGAVKTFDSSSSSRSAASTNSIGVNQGVKSVVSLYLMIDTGYKYAIAKVKSADNGSYSVTAADVKDFLVTPPTTGLSTDYDYLLPDAISGITSSSSDADILTAFQSLGPLTVRALYITDGKARSITAMADPTSTDEVRVDPIVSKVASAIIGKLVETIKSTLDSISSLSDTLKKALLSSILTAVKDAVVSTLESVKDITVFELPEGTDAATVADPESLLEVEIDSAALAALTTEIESTDVTVTIDTTSIAVTDSGKLADTLTDEEKGELSKKADDTSTSASTAVASEDATAGKKDQGCRTSEILSGPWFSSHRGPAIG